MAFHTRAGRLVQLHCLRCSHRWAPRVREWPNRCPECKSQLWHTARTTRQGLRPWTTGRELGARTKLRFKMLKVPGIACQRCGHEWVPRNADPRQCPKCRSVRFDTPKKTA